MGDEAARNRLLDRLADHARSRPGAEALGEAGSESGRTRSFGLLAERVGILASTLAAASPGGVVLLACPNRIEFPIAYLAVLAAGHVIMPVHPRLTTPDLMDLAQHVS